MEVESIWKIIREETQKRAEAEPVLASFFHMSVLEHESFLSAVASQLANDLSNSSIQPLMIRNVIRESLEANPDMLSDISFDLTAVKDRDPACKYYSTPLLFYKGFKALQSHKVSNWLWFHERHSLALFFRVEPLKFME